MNHLPWLMLTGLLALVAALAVAVGRTGAGQAPKSAQLGPSWAEQIEAVRRGESTAIRTQQRVSDAEFQQLRGLAALRDLRLENGAVTAEGLAVLRELPQLETLWLWNCRVDNEGMNQIAQNEQLQRLNLPSAVCDDKAFALLLDLPQLIQLRFSSSNVTEQGLAQLSRCKTLRLVHLMNVPVTDQVLVEVARLPKLESLYFDGVDVPEEAMQRFFAARPDVHVHIDQLHHARDPKAHKHGRPHPHPHPHRKP